MEPRRREVLIYTDAQGRRPFEEWLAGLKDIAARAVIRARVARLEGGNLGDCRALGAGVQELRIHHGPGYRLYFAEAGNTLILLLCGGSKRTQSRDIERAKRLWAEAQETL
jgi:putative addiction module killer protein